MAKQQRKTIDTVFILLGSVVAVVLLVVGCLALKAADFAKSTVQTELSQQKIYFPEKGSRKSPSRVCKVTEPAIGAWV